MRASACHRLSRAIECCSARAWQTAELCWSCPQRKLDITVGGMVNVEGGCCSEYACNDFREMARLGRDGGGAAYLKLNLLLLPQCCSAGAVFVRCGGGTFRTVCEEGRWSRNSSAGSWSAVKVICDSPNSVIHTMGFYRLESFACGARRKRCRRGSGRAGFIVNCDAWMSLWPRMPRKH